MPHQNPFLIPQLGRYRQRKISRGGVWSRPLPPRATVQQCKMQDARCRMQDARSNKRRNVDVLMIPNVCLEIGTQNPENRRASRAETLIFRMIFNDFRQKGCPNPWKSARFARRNVDFPKDFQWFTQKGGTQNVKNISIGLRIAKRISISSSINSAGIVKRLFGVFGNQTW